jgi:hypothetical protein
MDRLNANANTKVNDQKAEIELLKQQLKAQQIENEALRSFVCSKHPEESYCRALAARR